MYWHSDETDEFISLHDCKATKAEYADGELTLHFPDGFWICSGHPQNNTENTIRTDEAEVRFHLSSEDKSDICIYVFTEKKHGIAMRTECKLGKFVKNINSGKYTVEFLYHYKGFGAGIIECWIWLKNKPYHKECEIKLSTDKTTYCWNSLCENKSW